ncbi:hypothetical protein AAA294_07410 [Fusobacterium varium]|uniref:hypothetical protein n=1 Tax=Fusobacterium varium TaxID=856 RepID=UPI0032C146C3
MKYTINGYSQKKLNELNIDLETSLILRVIGDLYTSNSGSMEYKIIKDDKYMWCTYSYIYQQIPIIGSEKTLVRKINSLIEKEILKKELLIEKNGRKGKYLYIAFGKNYASLTEYSDDDETLSPLGTNCPIKDSSITNSSIVDYKEREKEEKISSPVMEAEEENKETSNSGAYYQTVRMLLASFTGISPESIAKLGKPIERIKAVIKFAQKYGKGEGWIFSAIKYNYSLDSEYLEKQVERKKQIEAKKIQEEKKKTAENDALLDFV